MNPTVLRKTSCFLNKQHGQSSKLTHAPMIGEWVALPVMNCIGSTVGDTASLTVLTPTAERLLQHCDAALRLPGQSTGADNDVRIAQQRGIPVYTQLTQIPGYEP